MQHSFLLYLIQFDSFHIEFLAALAFLQSAVALGGRMGVVPDNRASGTTAEPAPDCSLLPSSSLAFPQFAILCMFAHLQHTNVCKFSNPYHSFSLLNMDLFCQSKFKIQLWHTA